MGIIDDDDDDVIDDVVLVVVLGSMLARMFIMVKISSCDFTDVGDSSSSESVIIACF